MGTDSDSKQKQRVKKKKNKDHVKHSDAAGIFTVHHLLGCFIWKDLPYSWLFWAPKSNEVDTVVLQ